MAAPATKTVGNLSGKWLLNKTLSDPVDPALTLQGVGWLIRKAIGAASVTLHVKQYQAPPAPPSTSADPVTHVDIQQVATAGLKGTSEQRSLDYAFREHSDWLFGTVRGQSRWISAGELADTYIAEAKAKGWVQDDFLARDWIEEGEGGTEKGGPGAGETHVLNHVENLDPGSGWTATQVWGFQMVGGERRYARNVVVAKDGKFVAIKMIYDWISEE